MKRAFVALVLMIVIASCNNSETGHTKTAASKRSDITPTKTIRNILFFGNSLTAGYGLEDPSEAFPAQIQKKIDSARLPYRVINAGLSGETTAGGKNRIDWILKQKIDVFVLELGANDGLRGIAVKETKANLQAIVDKVKAKYPTAKLVLLGMEVPPNMGGSYANEFREVFREIASRNKMIFVPFLLKGVAGEAKLNLKDGIHPTGEGYRIVASTVWQSLEQVL